MGSPFLKSIRSIVDDHKEFIDNYNEIMRKQNTETLRRTLETRQVSAEEISTYRSKCEAMDEMYNLVEKRRSGTRSSGQSSSDSDASQTAVGQNPVPRKGGFTESLDQILKKVDTNCSSERSMNPDEPSSSSTQNHELQIMAENLSVLGMGGIGKTTINNKGSTINYTFGTVHMTNYNHPRKTTRDDGSE